MFGISNKNIRCSYKNSQHCSSQRFDSIQFHLEIPREAMIFFFLILVYQLTLHLAAVACHDNHIFHHILLEYCLLAFLQLVAPLLHMLPRYQSVKEIETNDLIPMISM